MIEKEKVQGDKRGLGYLSKFESPINGKTTFVKPKKALFLINHSLGKPLSALLTINLTVILISALVNSLKITNDKYASE